MKMFRKEEGFTLVELMVVVLIIGILVAIAIPVFNAARDNAQLKSCMANERTVEGAFQTWLADGPAAADITAAKANWAGLIGALVPGNIAKEPECPAEGTYSVTFAGDVPTVDCTVHGTLEEN